jgi:hypothetical protein
MYAKVKKMVLYKFFTTLSCDLYAKHVHNETVRFSACFVFVTTQQILIKFVSVRTEMENLQHIDFGL